MAKEKIAKVTSEVTGTSYAPTAFAVPEKVKPEPLTQSFGSDEINSLRDKINELIKFVS